MTGRHGACGGGRQNKTLNLKQQRQAEARKRLPVVKASSNTKRAKLRHCLYFCHLGRCTRDKSPVTLSFLPVFLAYRFSLSFLALPYSCHPIIAPCLTSPYRVFLVSPHCVSCHSILSPYLALPCLALLLPPYRVSVSCLGLPCLARVILWCFGVSCHPIVSCLALLCLMSPCRALPCSAVCFRAVCAEYALRLRAVCAMHLLRWRASCAVCMLRQSVESVESTACGTGLVGMYW